MKRVTIGIPESYYAFFRKFMRSFLFVVVIEEPEEKVNLNNIETSLKQMNEVKSGKRKACQSTTHPNKLPFPTGA